MVEVYAQADAMTGKGCNPNYFRVNMSDSMLMNAIGEFLKDKGVRTWDIADMTGVSVATLAQDYAFGRDSAEKFKTLVKSQGDSIGKVLFVPDGTADFGAKISQLGADPAEGLYVTIHGSDAINLAKQQAQFGLFSKYRIVMGNTFAIQQTLPAQGDAVLGVYQPLSFVSGEPGAEAEAFVRAYQLKYGEQPPYTAADQYAAIQLMAAAINKSNSDINAVRAALSGLKTITVLGDAEVRATDHQTARPILINQIVKGSDGKPTYEIKRIMSGAEVIPPVDPACKM